jgi:hypothetical protein
MVIPRSGLFLVASLGLLPFACATGPPRNSDDLCDIFGEKRSWHAAAREANERWGVPEAVQLAIIHQESRFQAEAKPPRRRLFGIIPTTRLSSAYGYGQVKAGTWDDYRRSTGHRGADRDDFEDVVDFIGWYGNVIQRATGVPKHDAYRLYLAYHEGPSGYRRGSYEKKPWLKQVARKVDARARRYAAQYAVCREKLGKPRRGWFGSLLAPTPRAADPPQAPAEALRPGADARSCCCTSEPARWRPCSRGSRA